MFHCRYYLPPPPPPPSHPTPSGPVHATPSTVGSNTKHAVDPPLPLFVRSQTRLCLSRQPHVQPKASGPTAQGAGVSQAKPSIWCAGPVAPKPIDTRCCVSQQQTSVSERRVYCHNEIQDNDLTFYINQSQHQHCLLARTGAQAAYRSSPGILILGQPSSCQGITRPLCFSLQIAALCVSWAASLSLSLWVPGQGLTCDTSHWISEGVSTDTWRQYAHSFGQKTLKWAPSSGGKLPNYSGQRTS